LDCLVNRSAAAAVYTDVRTLIDGGNMLGRLAKTIAVTAFAGGSVLLSAGEASAAHCVEGDSPGFSYFGTTHVQEADHNEGQNSAHSPGASSCRADTGSPSERAPGQNR